MSTCDHSFRFIRYDQKFTTNYPSDSHYERRFSPLVTDSDFNRTLYREVFYCTKCLEHRYVTPEDLREENPWFLKTTDVVVNNYE